MGKFIDLTDKRFGRLTVFVRAEDDKHRNIRWYCHCDCGNFTTVLGGTLRNGTSQSCGCRWREHRGSKPINLLGKRYSKLVVLAEAGRSRWGDVLWHCLCDCGQFHIAVGRHLRRGATKSCGCNRHLPLGQAAKNALLQGYRWGAGSRGLAWELTDEEFFEATQQPCHYCGIPPIKLVYGNPYGNYPHNGIDRKDNSQGYVKENVVPCCSDCNFMKSDKSYDDFIIWLDRVATFWFSKKKGANNE